MAIRVAIIGSGFGMYTLLPAFSKIQDCKVVSICGKKSERMQNFCDTAGVEKIYSDWKKMLQTEKPNAVAIAVVPKHQYEIAKYALTHGIAVFAEKPLTTSVSTASELCELAKKNKLPNMVDFIYPEIPEWIKAKELIETRKIGKILSVTVNWNFLSYDLRNQVKSWKTDASEGGGALSFFASHVFYYLEYFLGNIKSLQCVLSTSKSSLNKGDTIVDALILFENDCTGNIHLNLSYIGQPKNIMEFQGEDGTILLQNTNPNFVDDFELMLTDKSTSQKIKASPISDVNPKDDPRVKLVKSIAHKFILWNSTGISAKPNFQDGLRVQELIELARISNLNQKS